MNYLRFICAQPHDKYFQWQIEVLITNFREHKVSHLLEVLVFYPRTGLDSGWKILEGKYPEVGFYYYEDDLPQETLDLYIPVLRPRCLWQHFEKHAERLKGDIFFYHDADIIFNYLPDFQTLCAGDVNWQSDTSSYLDYSYLSIKEKQGKIPEGEVIRGLANLTGVSVESIVSHDKNSGGAQYILKGIDADFWKEVEEDCLKIRKFLMKDVNTKYFENENAGYQSWCADMWAVNFNLWKRGKITSITSLLDFSWATDHIDTYYKKPIFHNAGATADSKNLFFKGRWITKSPIGRKITASENFASSKYVEAIKKVR